MKRISMIAIVVLALSAAALGQKSAGARSDPAKGVHAAFDRLIEGIKQVDADKVMSVYDKSDKLLIFNDNGSATIGWDNVKNNVTASYPKITNVTLEITGLHIDMLGSSAAYVTCKWVQTQENDGKLENASGRMTLVFRLIGKEWKIVHRHTSPDNPGPNRPVFPSERTN